MNAASRWQRVRELFHACIELDQAQRDALLTQACAEDSELKSEVESLLASLAASKTFMETPAAAAFTPSDEPSWIGRTLGAYKIISLLAVGGMGEVYRAIRADGLYPQAVAIKLIRRELAGQVMLSRFRAEREILAALQHPNIARILDAGITEAGLPYIVMELIEGESIDQYCEHHGLSVRQRLELFIEVCAAVHFAHQHLTVHRDLKPGNILVTNDGVVKLLDFGIAKVLDADGPVEALTSMHAMTPEYSSPEQIRGEPITTATDIYSLGVVLYRLLTGSSPYRSSNNDPYALAREVCDTEPLRPSANVAEAATYSGRKQLAGDLDSIVLMALRKERDKRYESVQQFSADVQRYLDNRTVTARPRTWGYSASRFIARNRAVSLASLLLIIVLVAGIVATQRQAKIAAAERDRAQRHFDSVRQLANSFMFDMHDEIAKLPGSIKARQLLVNKALTYLDLLAKEPGGDPALQLELAEAYMRVGGVQGQIGYNNLGDHAAALRSFQQAIALLEQALGRDPASRPESIQLARAYNLASANLKALGRPAEELAMTSKEIDLMQRRLTLFPDSVEVLARVGQGFYRRSQFRSGHGDPAGATADAQRAVDLYEKVVAKDSEYKYRNNLVFAYSNLGEIQLKDGAAGGPSKGIDSLRKALATMRVLAADKQDDVNAQRHLAVTAAELGASLLGVGQPREGLPYVEETLPIFQALYDADKTNRLARLDLAETQENAGNLWISLGDPAKAVDHCRTAVQLLGAPPIPPESDLEISAAMIEAQMDLAQAYASAARAAGAWPKRKEFWREARLSASASLQTAQTIVAKKPEIAADYAAFIAKDKELLARH
ncbi:MAG TPA: protein kinase [Steroidobacteraceae bacterium]|jgi:serine/threonine protein kinase|nr:protein kinase [Steroidobacteraceae bacterium]